MTAAHEVRSLSSYLKSQEVTLYHYPQQYLLAARVFLLAKACPRLSAGGAAREQEAQLWRGGSIWRERGLLHHASRLQAGYSAPVVVQNEAKPRRQRVRLLPYDGYLIHPNRQAVLLVAMDRNSSQCW
ncbi:hypothetical protein RvY_14025 [Ramazzottius varieornatus]|uniref:Uncharacterized protein n=1 Tax=Ramazzottius varieornatus TaxID=947166 RepID=A0A1D1VYE3_RAMVA|nr:hypothetical protein RvY_14025 [Ramazzottius varieornatus]